MRRTRVVPVALAACGAALLHVAAALRTPLGAASDDALHLLLARNLLRGGFALPGPGGVPATDPLPGFPLLLSLPAAVLAPRWGLLRAVSLAAAALLVWGTWRLARRLLGEEAALAAAALVALNHVLVGWAGVALPDILYAALSLLVVAEGRSSFVAVAALLRPHGALLAVATAAGAKAPLRFAAAALLPLGAWLLRNALVSGSATAYVANAKDQADLLASWTTLPAHAWKLSAECLGRGVLGWPPGFAAGLGGLALLAACVWGARELWRRGRERALLRTAGLYLAFLVVVHLVWRPWQSRYALTVMPFAWITLLAASRPLFETRKPLAWALVGLLAAPGLSRGFGYAFEGLAEPRVELWPRSASWLRAHVPQGERVVSLEPYLLTLTTDREAFFPRPAENRARWLERMRAEDARWVFLRNGRARAYLSADARALMTSFDAWAVAQPPLSLAFQDEGEGVTILRLD